MGCLPKRVLSHVLPVVTLLACLPMLAPCADASPVSVRDGQMVARGEPAGELPRYAPGEILFKLKDAGTRHEEALSRVVRRFGLSGVDRAVRARGARPWKTVYRARLRAGAAPDLASTALEADPAVEWAEPNYYRYTQTTTPNDPSFGGQGYLWRIDAPSAWDVTTGSASVVIAVIDTGVKWDHTDLSANIWTNAGETAGDGLDNDGNGYVDDVRGWDFVSVAASEVYSGEDPGPPDNDPMDFEGHGTHVSGIAGAVGNNGVGVCGVNWTCRLMALRAGYKNKNGSGVLEIADVAAALAYAADNGAHIVNMSYGSPDISHTERLALDYCAAAGVLLVAAAGNDSTDAALYPAAFDDVLAVASLDSSNRRSSFSNYGPWVDIAAPGDLIYSTTVNGAYGYKSGTSMACPVAAGVAGLVKARLPSCTPDEMSRRMRVSVQDITGSPAFEGWLGSGRIQADSSVAAVYGTYGRVRLAGMWIEEVTGTADGFYDPGETIRIWPLVRNEDTSRTGVKVQLDSNSDPYRLVSDYDCVIGDVASDRTVVNWGDPIEIALASNTPADYRLALVLRVKVHGYSVHAPTVYLYVNRTLRDPLKLATHTSSISCDYPRLLLRPGGGMTLIYHTSGFTENQVYARSTNASGTWDSAVRLSDTPLANHGREHHGAVASDGRVHVCFLGVTGSWQAELFYTSRDPASGAWSAPLKLTTGAKIFASTIPGFDAPNVIAADPSGRPHIVWADYRSGAPELYYMYHNGSSWSSETVVAALSGDPEGLGFAMDSTGKGYVTWGQQDDYSIYMATLSGGVWSAPSVVTSTSWTADPVVALDSLNKLHMAYSAPNQDDIAYRKYESAAWSGATQVAVDTYYSGPSPLIAVGPANNPCIMRLANPDFLTGGVIQLYETAYTGSSWPSLKALTFEGTGTGMRDPDLALDGSENRLLMYGADTDPSPTTLNDIFFTSSVRDPSRQPSTPVVTDDGDWTTTSTSIHATWSSSHSSGIAEYEHAVGTVPGQGDVRYWTSAGTGTSATINLADTPMLPGQAYYVSVRARSNGGYWSPVGTSNGIQYATGSTVTSVADAKSAGDSRPVDIAGAIVSGAFTDYFYIESDDRSSGIRVYKQSHGLAAGVRANVLGLLKTNGDGERYIEAASAGSSGSGSVDPLGLTNIATGGGPFQYNPSTGAGQMGVEGAAGLNNIGLLVRTWGKVTAKSTDYLGTYLYIDDGSDVRDGTEVGGNPRIGVRVYCDTSGYLVDDVVEATGISSCFMLEYPAQPLIGRRILTRSSLDVRKITGP